MFFVVDRPRLLRIIALVREDKARSRQGADSPFLRLAAKENELRVSAEKESATFPATVYEPGVLFIRTTLFRRLVRSLAGEKCLTFQVTAEGLHFGDVHMPFQGSDMILYPKPGDAPEQWPPPPPESERIPDAKKEPSLFDMLDT